MSKTPLKIYMKPYARDSFKERNASMIIKALFILEKNKKQPPNQLTRGDKL